MSEAVISGLIFGLCAATMIVIGIWQVRSREPVGFYSGEKGPSREQVTDVRAWNRGHGMMWIVYGVCIIAAGALTLPLSDGMLALIPITAGVIAPIPLMILRHNQLMKRYLKK